MDNTNIQAPLAKHAINKTQKKPVQDIPDDPTVVSTSAGAGAGTGTGTVCTALPDHFRNLLDESAREAFTRPWHRLERGLRLNRLRMYVEQIGPQCSFTAEEKIQFFGFLQRALDKKHLNTHKIVNYIPEQQHIDSIRGLEVRRAPDGSAKWGFSVKKTKEATTRKKKKVAGDDADDAKG